MTGLFDRPCSARAVRWCYALLGAALAGLAVQELTAGHLRGHAGDLWLRHLAAVPLLPPAAAAALWALQIACGAAVAFGVARRAAVRLGAALLCVSLTQCWFNQKMLLALTFLALALDPPEPDDAGVGSVPRPVLGLVAAQLVLVYAASVAYKARDGFANGEPLLALFAQLSARGMSGLGPTAALGAWAAAAPGRAAALSGAVVLAEAALPIVLILRPRWGVAGAAVLHAGLALFMPGIWAFGAAMLGGAVLFLGRDERPPIR